MLHTNIHYSQTDSRDIAQMGSSSSALQQGASLGINKCCKQQRNFALSQGTKIICKFICLILLLLWQQTLLAAPLQFMAVHVSQSHDVINCDFTLNKFPLYRIFALSRPARIVIDVDNAVMLGHVNRAELAHTPIKNIRSGKHANNSLRIVIDTANVMPFKVKVTKDNITGKAHLIVSITTNANVHKEKPSAEKITANTIKKPEIKKKEIKKVTQTKPKPQPAITTKPVSKTTKESTGSSSILHQAKEDKLSVKPKVTYYKIIPQKTTTKTTTHMSRDQFGNKNAESMAKKEVKSIKPEANVVTTISIPIPPLSAASKLIKNGSDAVLMKKTTKDSAAMPIKEVKKSKVEESTLKTNTTSASTVVTAKKTSFLSRIFHFWSKSSSSVAIPTDKNKESLRDVIIVIDPGHGGKDPGAQGSKGTKEKDVVLAIAKKLQGCLNDQKGYKAVLTRDADYFVNLHERLRIAHANKADIFLSLHADAYKDSLIKGTTVFALSHSHFGATSEAADWLANRENVSELNSANLKSNTELHSQQLFNLVQKTSVKRSLLIGRAILSSLTTINNLHASHIEQADFVVLQSPDIPSLLIEVGFISDPNDEQRLNDPLFQEMFARAVVRGVTNYFAKHPIKDSMISQWKTGSIGIAQMDSGSSVLPHNKAANRSIKGVHVINERKIGNK